VKTQKSANFYWLDRITQVTVTPSPSSDVLHLLVNVTDLVYQRHVSVDENRS